MKINLDNIRSLLISLSLGGYPFIAAISSISGIQSTPLSYGLRLSILSLSIIIIIHACNRIKSISAPFIAFLVFWIFYIARLYADTQNENILLSKESYEYWFWAIGGSLLPALGFATSRKEIVLTNALKLTYILIFLALLVTSLTGNTIATASDGFEFETGRLKISSLNSISLGHAGLTLAIASYWILRQQEREKYNMASLVANTIGITLGIYILFASASKGPILSFIAVVFIFIASLSLRKFIYTFPLIIIILSLTVFALLEIENYTKFQLMSRIINSADDEGSVGARLTSFNGGIAQFLENPLFGSSLEEKITRSYPHNVLIESYMSTGIIGGLAFTILIFFGVYSSYKILSFKLKSGWIGLIFIQYLVGAQFSGSIYGSTNLWTFLTLTLVSYMHHSFKKKSRPQRNSQSSPNA